MNPFKKINELVEETVNKEKLKSLSIVINKEKIKAAKYGKYAKPIQVSYKFENGEESKVQNPEYVNKIPSTIEDCIDVMGTKYSAICVDCKKQRSYVGSDNVQHTFYECAVGVIRNPLLIKQCEDMEAEAYKVSEFEF